MLLCQAEREKESKVADRDVYALAIARFSQARARARALLFLLFRLITQEIACIQYKSKGKGFGRREAYNIAQCVC